MFPAKTSTVTNEVLIVGASPTGLVMACELLRHGISCRIIDPNRSAVTTSKGCWLYPRTLELLERLNVVEAMHAQGQPLYEITAHSDGRHLTTMTFDMHKYETRYNYILALTQMSAENLLREQLAKQGVQVEYGTQLQRIAQDAHGVTTFICDATGQERQIYTSWLVGCDGANSSVRRQLGLQFAGTTTNPWLITDANITWELSQDPQDTLHVFFSDEGTVLAFPFLEVGRWGILDTAPDLTETTSEQEVIAQLTRKIRVATGCSSITINQPGRISTFSAQQCRVPILRVGRSFVAGDAAHSYSPITSQEINVGIQDAFNLAWKLALVSKGITPTELLDSYTLEREPVMAATLQETQFITQLISMHERSAREVRDTIITSILNTDSLRETLMQRTVPSLVDLNVAYQENPFLREDWIPATGAMTGMDLHPGTRVPDLQIGTARGAHTQHLAAHLRGTKHILFVFSGKKSNDTDLSRLDALTNQIQTCYGERLSLYIIITPTVAQKRLQWPGIILLDNSNPAHSLHQHFDAYAPSLYLVRPDGYVAYRNQPADGARLFAYLETLFVHPNADRVPERTLNNSYDAQPAIHEEKILTTNHTQNGRQDASTTLYNNEVKKSLSEQMQTIARQQNGVTQWLPEQQQERASNQPIEAHILATTNPKHAQETPKERPTTQLTEMQNTWANMLNLGFTQHEM